MDSYTYNNSFLTFNDLNIGDRSIFSQAGLGNVLHNSLELLKDKIKTTALKKNVESFICEENCNVINDYITDMLEMVGDWSNNRYGTSALDQHKYFSSSYEEVITFPTHLFIARWRFKQNKLLKMNNANSKKMESNLKETTGVFLKKHFKNIKSTNRIRYGKFKFSETETRAIGAIYMISLTWNLLKNHQHDNHFTNGIRIGVELHSLFKDLNDLLAYSEGGKVGNKKRDFSESYSAIENLCKKEPNLATSDLLIRASQVINGLGLDSNETPGRQHVLSYIRNCKKNLR